MRIVCWQDVEEPHIWWKRPLFPWNKKILEQEVCSSGVTHQQALTRDVVLDQPMPQSLKDGPVDLLVQFTSFIQPCTGELKTTQSDQFRITCWIQTEVDDL